MNRVELLTVTDQFQIGGFGLVLYPDFSVPNGSWKNREELVSVIEPSGEEFETNARFYLSHFNIRDLSVSIDRRWRVVVSLPDKTKQEVPTGSKLCVSQELRDALLEGVPALE